MKNFFIIIIILIIAFLIGFNLKAETIKIAACPTFYYLLAEIESDQIQTIKTQSTAESINLLEEEEVDLIISGRPLKEQEPDFLFTIIGPGYDFLFEKELFMKEEQMQDIIFYTNLSIDKISEDFSYITKIEKVDNILDYLQKGIVITKLENRLKGELVHIVKENGSRVRLSRRPRLYSFSQEKIDIISKIIQ